MSNLSGNDVATVTMTNSTQVSSTRASSTKSGNRTLDSLQAIMLKDSNLKTKRVIKTKVVKVPKTKASVPVDNSVTNTVPQLAKFTQVDSKVPILNQYALPVDPTIKFQELYISRGIKHNKAAGYNGSQTDVVTECIAKIQTAEETSTDIRYKDVLAIFDEITDKATPRKRTYTTIPRIIIDSNPVPMNDQHVYQYDPSQKHIPNDEFLASRIQEPSLKRLDMDYAKDFPKILAKDVWDGNVAPDVFQECILKGIDTGYMINWNHYRCQYDNAFFEYILLTQLLRAVKTQIASGWYGQGIVPAHHNKNYILGFLDQNDIVLLLEKLIKERAETVLGTIPNDEVPRLADIKHNRGNSNWDGIFNENYHLHMLSNFKEYSKKEHDVNFRMVQPALIGNIPITYPKYVSSGNTYVLTNEIHNVDFNIILPTYPLPVLDTITKWSDVVLSIVEQFRCLSSIEFFHKNITPENIRTLDGTASTAVLVNFEHAGVCTGLYEYIKNLMVNTKDKPYINMPPSIQPKIGTWTSTINSHRCMITGPSYDIEQLVYTLGIMTKDAYWVYNINEEMDKPHLVQNYDTHEDRMATINNYFSHAKYMYGDVLDRHLISCNQPGGCTNKVQHLQALLYNECYVLGDTFTCYSDLLSNIASFAATYDDPRGTCVDYDGPYQRSNLFAVDVDPIEKEVNSFYQTVTLHRTTKNGTFNNLNVHNGVIVKDPNVNIMTLTKENDVARITYQYDVINRDTFVTPLLDMAYMKLWKQHLYQ